MSSALIPDPLAQTIAAVFGRRGVEWLRRFPHLLADCSRRWALRVEPPFPNLTYNFVAPATTAEGRPVVLKMGVPNPELTSEADALRIFGGRSAVRLLDVDVEEGVLLLERVYPGVLLSTIEDDDEATIAAARVMRELWRPVPEQHRLRSVTGWARGFERLRDRYAGGTGPLPADLVAEAEETYRELTAAPSRLVVLHGDLHHENILAATREPWLAIDPKGLVGEPEYEPGALLRNPLPGLLRNPDPRRILARRLDLLAEHLAFDPRRMQRWAVAQAVLSAWWSIEDNETGWEMQIACARLLSRL